MWDFDELEQSEGRFFKPLVVCDDADNVVQHAASESIESVIWQGSAEVAQAIVLFGPSIIALPFLGKVCGLDEVDCLAYSAHPKVKEGGLMDRADLEAKYGCLDPRQVMSELHHGMDKLYTRLEEMSDLELRKEVVLLQDWSRKVGGRVKLLERRVASELLGIQCASADVSEVNRAFKRKALELHPDKGGDEESFKLLQEMKDVLLDLAVDDQVQDEKEETQSREQKGEFDRSKYEEIRLNLHRAVSDVGGRISRLAQELKGAQAKDVGANPMEKLHKFIDNFVKLELGELASMTPDKADSIFRRFLEVGCEVICAAGIVNPASTAMRVTMSLTHPLMSAVPSSERLHRRCAAFVQAIEALPSVFDGLASLENLASSAFPNPESQVDETADEQHARHEADQPGMQEPKSDEDAAAEKEDVVDQATMNEPLQEEMSTSAACKIEVENPQVSSPHLHKANQQGMLEPESDVVTDRDKEGAVGQAKMQDPRQDTSASVAQEIQVETPIGIPSPHSPEANPAGMQKLKPESKEPNHQGMREPESDVVTDGEKEGAVGQAKMEDPWQGTSASAAREIEVETPVGIPSPHSPKAKPDGIQKLKPDVDADAENKDRANQSKMKNAQKQDTSASASREIKAARPREAPLPPAHQLKRQSDTQVSNLRSGSLPTSGDFMVVNRQVFVRGDASTDSKKLNILWHGDIVSGSPRNVDGDVWLHLNAATHARWKIDSGSDAWVLVHGQRLGLGKLLQQVHFGEARDVRVEASSGRDIRVLEQALVAGSRCHFDRRYIFTDLGDFGRGRTITHYIFTSNDDKDTPADRTMWRLEMLAPGTVYLNFRSEGHVTQTGAANWLRKGGWERTKMKSTISTGFPNGPYSGPVFSKAVRKGKLNLMGSNSAEGTYFVFVAVQK